MESRSLAVFSLLLASASLSAEEGFTLLPPAETGIVFENVLDDRAGAKNRTLMNGSGVAAADVDGDGLVDLFFCGLENGNALYRNLGGWKFEDITRNSGLGREYDWCRAAAFADLDADGDQDLLIGATLNRLMVYVNDGSGRFTDATFSSGISSSYATVALALADIDGDGDLDLYTGNNRNEDSRDIMSFQMLQDGDGNYHIPPAEQYRFRFSDGETSKNIGDLQEYGEPDYFYKNDGNGKFERISWTDGAFLDEDGNVLDGPPKDWTLTATFRDVDGDGDPDLYTCSDYWTEDRMWINDGSGRFQAAPRLALRSTSNSSMGVDFADVDRDGHPDFLVVDMLARDHQRQKMQMGAMQPTPLAIGAIENRPQIMRNTFFHNRGDGTFAEIANYAGLAASEWSWQPIFLDVDLDGYEDVLISAGHARDVQDTDSSNRIAELREKNELLPANLASSPSLSRQQRFTEELYHMMVIRPVLESPVVAFRNNSGDLTFSEKTEDWGTGTLGVHHGIAIADLDNDGDMDLVTNDLNSPASVYRNDATAPRLLVRLKGSKLNPAGVGAKIFVSATEDGSSLPDQSSEVVLGGRYLSSSEPAVTFAASAMNTVTVRWPDGAVTVREGVTPGILEIPRDDTAKVQAAKEAEALEPLFVEFPLEHSHHENGFDDFARQPLLPNRLSQLGPGLAFTDLDGDQMDDLVIPTGGGGKPTSFTGGLTARKELPESPDDQHTALVLGGETLFSTPAFETDAPQGMRGSALSAADIDGDGDLDIFLGRRSVAGRYPEPAGSKILLRDGEGTLSDGQVFEKIGLVTSSVFSDIDQDGDQDLVLAREWGSPMVWLNDGSGTFTDATESLGLASYSGWWNSVTTGDFDNDGRPDLVLGNWGRNSKYEHHYDAEHPLTILYRDFDESGSLDIVESIYDHKMGMHVPVRGLSCSSSAMPFIKDRLPTYTQFGAAGILDILGEPAAREASEVSASHLDHTLFLNRGDHFEAVTLPQESQFAPVFGIVATDFDNDGNTDLFVAQNFFASQIETPRIDAGRGLLLLGDGTGKLAPLSAAESGITVYGDARGAAFGDLDGDGRPDLAVAQNGAATRVFRNVNAPAGLRVIFDGDEDNPTAIGTSFRALDSQGKKGPLREIQAGGGYLSQNSSTVIVAPYPDSLEIHSPSGQRTVEIPTGREEFHVPAGR